MTTPTYLSIAALIISIGGIFYGIAYWRGKVDNELGWLKEKIKKYSDAHDRLTKMETKFEVVWSIFAEQILTDRPHLASKSSPLRLTEQAREALQEVTQCLKKQVNSNLSDQVLYNVPEQVGMPKLRGIAEKHNMTLGELLAVISLELSSNECE